MERVQGYVDLLESHDFELWLLSPATVGLAAARGDVICRVAGAGPAILMDDDAWTFAATKRSNHRFVSQKLTFAGVVERLLIAHREVPTSMVIGIQHWYRHASSPDDDGAVVQGLQHLAFQPLLLNLPSPVPREILPTWSSVEDDEFAYRVHEHYGSESILKLRYIIAKLDVGHMGGGLQGRGGGNEQLQRARRLQAAEAEEIVRAHPKAFQLVKSATKGRLSGIRARLRVDTSQQRPVQIRGAPAGRAIERAVRP